MFKKTIKIKSNSQIKGSERKSVKELLAKHFPTLTENDIETLLPKKDVVSSIKVVTSSDETVQIYAVQKIPLIFDIRGTIYPTICLLWKFPDLIPCLTTHRQVMSHLNSGADLMSAGVVTPPAHSGLSKYGNYSTNTIASVNLTDNKAPIAVGVTSLSSAEMAMSGGRGKCLTIVHLYGDKLCKLDGLNCSQMPNLGPPAWLKMKSYEDDFPQLGMKSTPQKEICLDVQPEIIEETLPAPVETVEDLDEDPPEQMTVEEMDQLLNYCFFAAVKYSKTLVLPILTSTFFKLQMLPVCPEGKHLDLKKSSYKKLKPFLDSMCKEGAIVVKEAKKGVESITSINKEHPKFNEFYIDPSVRPKKTQDEADAPSTSVIESYIVTPSTLPFFVGSRFGKGDTAQMPDIRKCVSEYVRNHDCLDEDNKRFIKPKGDLVKICRTENKITWEELMEKVCASMKSCYKVSSGMEEIVNKGKVSPINISVAMRSGNKKVTLVDNLELFGIKIPEFAKECQHGVAASTSISRPPGKKCDQLLVQGNQVLFVYNLLTEKYKVPQKYVKGLDNAPKKKK